MLFRVEWRWRTAFLTFWLTPGEVSHTNQPGCHRGWRWTAHLRLRDEDGMIYWRCGMYMGCFFVFFPVKPMLFLFVFMIMLRFPPTLYCTFKQFCEHTEHDSIIGPLWTWVFFTYVHIVFTIMFDLPSGNLLHSYWTWLFIVDFPIKHGVFPVRYVKLPEGIYIPFFFPSDFRCSKTSAEDFSMLQQPQTKKNGSAVSVDHGRGRCAAALGRFGRLLAGRRRCRGTTSGVAAKGFMEKKWGDLGFRMDLVILVWIFLRW